MRVIIETPYFGDEARTLAYARRAMFDSVRLNEAPLVSHLIYTQQGIDTKLAYLWHSVADMLVIYYDYGIPEEMLNALNEWRKTRKPVAYRKIGTKEE